MYTDPSLVFAVMECERIRARTGHALTNRGPGAATDSLNGGNGDDDLTGGAGADLLSGSAGNDTLHADDDEADTTINGAPDMDSAYYDQGIDPSPLAVETKIPA
jgi:Ca2+-binding RTX toxin-like protein